jgi:hypothetical protein
MSSDSERARERAVAWLERRPAAALAGLARRFAEALERDGLLFFDDAAHRSRSIPATLTPEALDPNALRELRVRGQQLLSAAVKAAHWTLSPAGERLGRRLYAGLTPLERKALQRDPARLGRLATARLDVFPREDGSARVLEINATIPAMQGYADMLSERWIRMLAAERGVAAHTETLVERGGANTLDLLASLLAWYRHAGGRSERPAILIVSRRNDAQQTELHRYERVFRAAGLPALAAFVDEVGTDEKGHVVARGTRFDLVYRHVFARRVDPASTFARLLVEPGPNLILNPVMSPLENKGLLALLHESLEPSSRSAALGLDKDEIEAVAALVPWTRCLRRVQASLADGTRTTDLVAWAARHPGAVVLKRSQDYGGRTVFVGPDGDTQTSGARMRALFGPECDSWSRLVARAANDPEPWVVQEYVPPPRRRHLLVERDAAGGVRAAWRELFMDLGVFLSLGVEAPPRGAAIRVATHPVVNLHGGGGMTPVISAPVLESLFPCEGRADSRGP